MFSEARATMVELIRAVDLKREMGVIASVRDHFGFVCLKLNIFFLKNFYF